MNKKKNKFYEFKNISSNEADLYVYGEIVTERDEWFGSESDVVLSEFKEELDKLENIKKLNMYINSPGGSVFAASTMVSMLERFKNNGHKVFAYVDGLSASAASFLMMVADKIKLYKNSIVMIHKPMSMAMGNSNDLQKTIDALDTIEDSVMIPLYLSKAKCEKEKIKDLIDAESWLSSEEMNEYFDVELLGVDNKAVACASNLFKNYKNTPDFIKNSLENTEKEEENEQNCNENASKKEVIEDNDTKTQENEEKTLEIENDVQDKQKKEREIKAKLDLIRSSIMIEKRKED